MNLLKIIFLINCLLILINTECTPDDDSLLKLDKIRKFDDCDKRVTKAELLENDAYKCCYLHYKADTRNVEADIHTCCLVTQSQYDNIKDTIKNYEDSNDVDVEKLDCKGYDLQIRLLFLLLLLFLY